MFRWVCVVGIALWGAVIAVCPIGSGQRLKQSTDPVSWYRRGYDFALNVLLRAISVLKPWLVTAFALLVWLRMLLAAREQRVGHILGRIWISLPAVSVASCSG